MKISKKNLTRSLLDSYVGKQVSVTFFDGETIEGTLQKGNGFFDEPKKYIVGNTCFRLSHIKNVEV